LPSERERAPNAVGIVPTSNIIPISSSIPVEPSAGTLGTLDFMRTTDGGFDVSRRTTFTLVPGAYTTYQITMKGVSNWDGVIQRFRLLPTDVSSAFVEIDYVRFYMPLAAVGPSYEFNNTGDVDGWVFNTGCTPPDVVAGVCSFLSVGPDPYMTSPDRLFLNASMQSMIEISMRVSLSGKAMLYYWVDGEAGFNSTHKLPFDVVAGSAYTTFRLDMSSAPDYSGLIRRLRFDPTNRAGVSIDIDFIRVVMPMVSPSPAYEFASSTQGWSAVNGTAPTASGDYLRTTATSDDPQLRSPTLSLDPKVDQFAYLAMRASAGTQGSMFFLNSLLGGSFTSTARKDFSIPTNADRVLYNVNLNSVASFQPGTISRLRVDPTTVNGADVMVDKVDVLSRTKALGTSWEFNVPGNAEGWAAMRDIVPVVGGGTLSGVSTGTSPRLESPPNINVNADLQPQILIKMSVSAGDSAWLFFQREGETLYSPSRVKRFIIANNTSSVLYNLSMNQLPTYNGVIRRLRLDPTTVKGATIAVDYVRAVGPVPSGSPEWRFETEADTEGWSSAGGVVGFTADNGLLTGTNGGGLGRVLSSAGLALDSSTKNLVGVRMKVSAGTNAILNWKRTTDSNFDSPRGKSCPIINNTDFQTYYIDLSGEASYTGTIDRLRLMPSNNTTATFEIDWIGFL